MRQLATWAAVLFVCRMGFGGEGVVILDSASNARCYVMAATPRIKREAGEIEPYSTDRQLTKAVKAEYRSSPPPAEKWREPDFDDGAWARVRGFEGTGSALSGMPVSVICARSRFELRDPAAAGPLTLALEFFGGAAVYLNGKEVARAFLPEGDIQPDTPAEVYPNDAYVDPDGFLLRQGWGDPEKYPQLFKNRVRTLNVQLPASFGENRMTNFPPPSQNPYTL